MSSYRHTHVGPTRRNHNRHRNLTSRNVKHRINKTRRNHNIQQSDFSLKVETVKRMADQIGYQELSKKDLEMYKNYIAKGLTKRDIHIMKKYIQAKNSSWTYWALFWFVKYLEVSGHIYNEMAKYQQLSHLRNVHQSKIDELKIFEQEEKAKDLIILKEAPKLAPIPHNANNVKAITKNANHVNVASSHINNVNHNSSASAHFMPHRSNTSTANTSSSRNSGVIPERAVVQRAIVRASLEDIATYFGNVSSVSGTPEMTLLAPNENCIRSLGSDKCPYILSVRDIHTEESSQLCNSCNIKNGCLGLRATGPIYTTTPFFKYLNDTLVPKGINVSVLVEYDVDQTYNNQRMKKPQRNNPMRSALYQMANIGRKCQRGQNGQTNMVCEFPNIHFEGVDVRHSTDSDNNGDTMAYKMEMLVHTDISSVHPFWCEQALELKDSSTELEARDTLDLYMKFYKEGTTMGEMFQEKNYQRTSRTYQELQVLEKTIPGAMQFFLNEIKDEPVVPVTGDFYMNHIEFPYETVQSFLQAIKDEDTHSIKQILTDGKLKHLGEKFAVLNMPAKIVDVFAAAKVLQRSNGELAVLHLGGAHTSNINKMLSRYYKSHYNWAKGKSSWFSTAPLKCAKK